MIVNPSISNFDVDTFSLEYTSGKIIDIIFIDESFLDNGSPCDIKDCIVQIRNTADDTRLKCPSIIGLGNDLMIIHSDDPSLLGQKLSAENIDDCYIEIYGY